MSSEDYFKLFSVILLYYQTQYLARS